MCSTFGHACRTHSSRAFQTAEFLKFHLFKSALFLYFYLVRRPYKRKNAGQPFLTDRHSQSLITHAQAFRLPLFHFPLINFFPLISRKSAAILTLTSGPARLLMRTIFLKQHTHKPCFLFIPAVDRRLLRSTILLTIYRVYDR